RRRRGRDDGRRRRRLPPALGARVLSSGSGLARHRAAANRGRGRARKRRRTMRGARRGGRALSVSARPEIRRRDDPVQIGERTWSLAERWVDNRGVRLHCLVRPATTEAAGMPFVIIAGTFGMAEDYVAEMTALAPRPCVAPSLRGRGQSDTPETGYTFEDHVA